jgi:hypothetical protein
MQSVIFSQLVESPTKVTSSSATLIGHAFLNMPQNIVDVFVPSLSISDHFPIRLTRKLSNISVKGPMHKTITFRSFKHFDENRFLTELSTLVRSSICRKSR